MNTTKGSRQLLGATVLGAAVACSAWGAAQAQVGPQTRSFQEGVNGYVGTQDTYLAETDPAVAQEPSETWGWDTDDPAGTGLDAYGLVRFDGIVGAGPGQVPAGATVVSATLQLQVWNGSAAPAGEVREVLVSWDEATATWDDFGGEPGAQADEYGASVLAAAPIAVGAASIDVTSSVQAWVSGTSANFGWIILPGSTDGVDIRSAEYVATPAERPRLVVEYIALGSATVFQDGVNGYSGTQDTELTEAAPALAQGSSEAWGWDTDDPVGSGLVGYGLVRFDGIVGAGPGQVPAGATVLSATLQLQVWDGGAAPTADVREVLVPWDEASTTWNDFGGEAGAQADEYGASVVATAPIALGHASIDVTSSVQSWVNGTSSNLGWIVLPDNTDGVDVRSAEYLASPGERPRLIVQYLPGGSMFSFQDGVGGYMGTQDTYLAETDPAAAQGAADAWGWDTDDPAGTGLDALGLVRFDGIVGAGPGQIPAGATVVLATLQLQAFNASVSPAGGVHEVLVSWDEGTTTWNDFGGEAGAQADEYAASVVAAAPVALGPASLDVTSSVQGWVNGTSANFGWIFLPNSTDGLDVRSAEYATPADRPKLTVYLSCTPISATDATCDGIDDDCSGTADEDFVPLVTTCGVGACASTGGTACVAGVPVVSPCTPGAPGTEACNAIDDNCNGAVDEGCSGSFSLVAKAFVKTVDGNPVPMWGFALDTGGDCATGPEVPSVPGPRLKPIGTPNLTITVRNCLTERISLVIPALGRALDPTFVDPSNTAITGTGNRPGGDVTSRIRSFDTEIAPGATQSYSWTGVRPGTYVYESGSHSAVQVPMGLYGMLSLDFAPGYAYDGVPYDNEALLVYSEIDPTRPIVPSALGYAPAYFLVNGEPYPTAAPSLDHPLAANERVLLRFLNAGSQNHVPTLLEGYMRAVGEDAHEYPYPRDQYGVLLPAGKTLDAVWTPDACTGSVALIDRRLWLTNAGSATPGGMLVKFPTSHDPAAPVANDDPSYVVAQGNTLAVAAPGVLANDASLDPVTAVLVTGPSNGTLDLNASGSFHYTPNVGFSGTDSFTYKANDCEDSGVATVTVTVTPVANTAPVATLDSGYIVAEDGALHEAAPGVLGNDSDPELNPMTAVLSTGVLHGTLILSPNGAFDYTPLANYSGPDSFAYRAHDGQLYSAVTTVSLSVTNTNDSPVANDDTAQTKRNNGALLNSVVIALLANDTDPDGNADIVATTRTIVVAPRYGTLVLNLVNGSVTYTPKPGFAGTDTFSYTVRDSANALSNRGVVRVNVTK